MLRTVTVKHGAETRQLPVAEVRTFVLDDVEVQLPYPAPGEEVTLVVRFRLPLAETPGSRMWAALRESDVAVDVYNVELSPWPELSTDIRERLEKVAAALELRGKP